MPKSTVAYLLAGLFALGITRGATVTITFDDLTTSPRSQPEVPDGYEDLHWHHFSYLDALDIRSPVGLHNAVVSPKNVAFDSTGRPAWFFSTGQPFDLDSAFLTAERRDSFQVRVQGFLNNTLKYDNIYSLDTSRPTLIEFNYLDITKATFIPVGSAPHFSLPFCGTPLCLLGGKGQFALDDVTITRLPEPGPAALLIAGSALTGFSFLRARQRTLRPRRRRGFH